MRFKHRIAPLPLLPLAAAVMLTLPAYAQEAQADVQQVVVSGLRAAEHATVQTKKATRQIVDAVSQDDIGQLPDFNIVEASRRIPGLSVVGGGDATKNRDIYQRATIRGLDSR